MKTVNETIKDIEAAGWILQCHGNAEEARPLYEAVKVLKFLQADRDSWKNNAHVLEDNASKMLENVKSCRHT